MEGGDETLGIVVLFAFSFQERKCAESMIAEMQAEV
jgi:hypothetical protein